MQKSVTFLLVIWVFTRFSYAHWISLITLLRNCQLKVWGVNYQTEGVNLSFSSSLSAKLCFALFVNPVFSPPNQTHCLASVSSTTSVNVHPCFHFSLPLYSCAGSQGGWSLSQLSSDARCATPWAVCQFVTSQHRDKPCTLIFTPKENVG